MFYPLHTHSPSYGLPNEAVTTTPPSLTPRPPEWSRAQPFDKLAEAYSRIHAMGGQVFTLRLELDALICVTGSRHPSRTMSRRIQRAFKRAGLPCPPLAFALEVTTDDRNELHLHGAILLGNLDLMAVKKVLRNAAGYISGRAGSRQVQIKNFNIENGGPRGWAAYVRPYAARTRRVIGHDRVTYISSEARQFARRRWNLRRREHQNYRVN